MSIRIAAAFAALISLSSMVHAAQAPRDLKDFYGLYPYHENKIWNLDEAEVRAGAKAALFAPRTAPLIIDLAKGTAPGACVTKHETAWTGQATYLNTDVGTLQWWGMGRGCHPTGIGTLQYADGSTYFGFVETSVHTGASEVDDIALSRDRTRVGIRQGVGQFTDAKTGQVQVGRWQADKLDLDLGADAVFIGLFQKVVASISDRGAPQYNAAILDWYNYETEGERAQRLAEEQQQKAAAAPSIAKAEPAVPAHLQRAQANAAAAKDLTRIPQPLLDAHPDLAALVPLLQQYGGGPMPDAPVISAKFFGGVKCKTPEGQPTAWTHTSLEVAHQRSERDALAAEVVYYGQHEGCFPRVAGRFREPSGVEWIGQLRNLRMRSEGLTTSIEDKLSPMPNGVGELRLPNGSRIFLRAEYKVPTKDGGSYSMFGSVRFTLLGLAGAEGTVYVDHNGTSVGSMQGETIHPLGVVASKFPKRASLAFHHKSGAIVEGDIELATDAITPGMLRGSGDRGKVGVVFTVPELGVRIEGGSQSDWGDRFTVALTQAYRGLPQGRYIPGFIKRKATPFLDGLKLVNYMLIPADAATVAALATLPNSKACKTPLGPGDVPNGWVVWLPSCAKTWVLIYSPDGANALQLYFDESGKVTTRQLIQYFGMAGSRSFRIWTAERFVERDNKLLIEGEAKYDVSRPDSPDAAGFTTLVYTGPFRGLTPDGLGLCAVPGHASGAKEPCEFRDGKRIDPAFQQRVRQRQQQLAQQQAAQQQWQAEQDAQRKAQEEQDALLAAQEAHEKEMRRLQDEQDDAEAEAAWASFNAKRDAERQAENAKFAADMQATQNQYNQAKAAAYQQQKAQQQAAQQGPPPGTYNAAKEAADQQLYQQKLAAQKKAYADAHAAQPAPPSAPKSSGYSGGSSGSSSYGGSSSTMGTELPKVDNSKQVYCSKLSMDIMAASSDFHCNMNGKSFPTMGARADAQNACYAEVAAKVAPLKAQYKDECSSTAGGGVTKY